MKMSKHSLTKFYWDKKKSLQKKTRDSNHSLSKEEKKQQYGHKRYRNLGLSKSLTLDLFISRLFFKKFARQSKPPAVPGY